VAGIHTAVEVATGWGSSCARLADGKVACWGDLAGSMTPTLVVNLDAQFGGSPVKQLALGQTHACARSEDGKVACWGDGSQGALGDGTLYSRTYPSGLASLAAPAVDITAGAFHTCAAEQDGTVQCWGANDYGQLGVGGLGGSTPFPTWVINLSSAIGVEAGSQHTCARDAFGQSFCWGDSSAGQLGIGVFGQARSSPAQLNLYSVTEFAAGGENTCALVGGAQLYCWGDNSNGAVGDGTYDNRATPVPISY
jgi:alpha-tubulin suppressor-like RCC1 family protein